MSDLLLLFAQHLERALLVVETSPHAREPVAREAHNLVSCAGMLGFLELARASRAMMSVSEEWKGVAGDLRFAIARARDRLARHRRLL